MLNVATVHPSSSEYFITTLQKRFDPTLSSYITLKRRYCRLNLRWAQIHAKQTSGVCTFPSLARWTSPLLC